MVRKGVPDGFRTKSDYLRGRGTDGGHQVGRVDVQQAPVPEMAVPHAERWEQEHRRSGEPEKDGRESGPTALQKDWLKWLNENGYRAVVCYGTEHAIKVLEYYLR